MIETDLESATRDVVRQTYEVFADHEIDEVIERLYRERTEQIRRLGETV